MANKRTCDRCGKEISVKYTDNLYFIEVGNTVWNDVELCEDCKKQFYEWLENKDRRCSCNKNVVELLDLIESHEKEICKQSSKIERLEKENEMLKNGTVKELLESMDIEISVSVKKKDE